jgi:ADP-L-glycero-D-manno-heptose 6-epimerase
VGDVVSVLHFALDHPLKRGIFNLGTGQARTFLDLTRAVFKALHREEKIEFIDTPIEIRDKYQYFTEANMQKLKAAGYVKPFTSLEDGVKQYLSRL